MSRSAAVTNARAAASAAPPVATLRIPTASWDVAVRHVNGMNIGIATSSRPQRFPDSRRRSEMSVVARAGS